MRSITSKLSTSPAYRMTRRIRGLALIVGVLLTLAGNASAQTPIIIGPTSTFGWDMLGTNVTPAIAQGWTYNLSVNGGAPITLVGPVTCVPAVPPVVGASCSVLVSSMPSLPLTSASTTLSASGSGITTLPSTPFAYVVIVIPIPTNLRIR